MSIFEHIRLMGRPELHDPFQMFERAYSIHQKVQSNAQVEETPNLAIYHVGDIAADPARFKLTDQSQCPLFVYNFLTTFTCHLPKVYALQYEMVQEPLVPLIAASEGWHKGLLQPNYMLDSYTNLRQGKPDLTIWETPALSSLPTFDAVLIFLGKRTMMGDIAKIVRNVNPDTKLYAVEAGGTIPPMMNNFTKVFKLPLNHWDPQTQSALVHHAHLKNVRPYKKIVEQLIEDLCLEGTKPAYGVSLPETPASKALQQNIVELVGGVDTSRLTALSRWIPYRYPNIDIEVLATLWEDGSIPNYYSLIDTLESIQGL